MIVKAPVIELNLDEYKANSYLTHNYHPYPAKFIPQIPRELIEKFTEKGDLIIDPFCGSGTALVEAKLLGRDSIGVDLNPIAYLISKVKTTILDDTAILEIKKVTNKICEEILLRSKREVPVFFNIDHWFKAFVQDELAIMKYYIDESSNIKVREFLTVAFSSIITKVSNQDSETRYAFKEKNIKINDSAIFFKRRVADMIERNIQFKSLASNSTCKVYLKDSTQLDFIKKEISVAITSPPYMNSFDYYLYHKHRMHWLDMDVKNVQEREFGSRNKHNDNGEGIETYKEAIMKNAAAVKAILKNRGKYIVIVGDSILRGELIKMNEVFDDIFVEQLHYSKDDEFKFDQRKYTKAFTPNLRSVSKETYILIYGNS